jgi:lipid II:glycine glycyltransferase (peptidoglycan interpeptide bridge formation enzyme)
MPFFWNGFDQTTRYTYVLNGLEKTEQLWSGFNNTTRAECKKASSRFKLTVRDDLPLDALLALNRMTFARQGMSVPYSDAFVRRLDAACAERGCRKFLIAVDSEGRPHAGNYIVWDENSAYGLINGADPALRTSGASSLCMWEMIKYAGNVTQRFDFTGSMLQPIERFLRGFGAIQMPYFNISKTPSKILQIRQHLLSALKRGGRRAGAGR